MIRLSDFFGCHLLHALLNHLLNLSYLISRSLVYKQLFRVMWGSSKLHYDFIECPFLNFRMSPSCCIMLPSSPSVSFQHLQWKKHPSPVFWLRKNFNHNLSASAAPVEGLSNLLLPCPSDKFPRLRLKYLPEKSPKQTHKTVLPLNTR